MAEKIDKPGDTYPTPEPCEQWLPLLTLYAAGDELEADEQSRVAAHIHSCAACSATVDQERELIELVGSNRAEPDANLLANCRASLQDALDHQEETGWLRRFFSSFVPANWLSPAPAWGAAAFLIVGFGIGILAPRMVVREMHPGGKSATPGSNQQALTSSPAENSQTSDSDSTTSAVSSPIDLRTADVAGINLLNPDSDAGAQDVELQLRSQRPVTLKGSVDNEDIKQVLLSVLNDGDRFCPDMRLDAVDCLKARKNDPQIRTALCNAVRTDSNPAVRLKALEALQGSDTRGIVRQTLLDALVDDENPGVRVEAMNKLRDLSANGAMPSDDHMLSVLRERMQRDPNTYIRLQSAALVRDLQPGPNY
jgi:HEAT repeats/Putative zinc-finger